MTVEITLFGATGFTGELTARYLSQHLEPGTSWAIAGRSADKLRGLFDRLVADGGVAPQVVVANHDDAVAMREMAENTRVLISTVGPYLQHGEPAVKAAAEAGITYLDLTGEPGFVDAMWLKYHEVAVSTGARLVHACGFDSIPYDLGTLYVVDQLPDDVSISVKGYIRANASFSGGTYHSAITQFSQLGLARKAAAERRRHEGRPQRRRIRGGGKPGRAPEEIGGYGVPLPTIDPQIVLRSARGLPGYGPDFSYEHYAHFRSLRMATAAGVGLGGAVALAQFGPTRSLLLKAQDPGQGPSEERRQKSWFRLSLIGEGGGQQVRAEVTGPDPGYDATAVMLAESALCLAFDEVPEVAGQTTTAIAMGRPLIDRLHRAGITFRTR
ncbi:saccharopine dehydrogenase [Aeromicrobium phragmitis]|uniref:Saccharopine dehydrogenase n=1 Tax=Aeromicrobium phragmitis TaxID=2478914 RepID=A0A3L8PIH9_9ACTN|nr:saccharopine dehydrogenase NADP-binding domain-containing protein [Aeromicrobium phragmitis]RLV55186.1 saccharopine dehydrogenase [Aeromicrobium phragmitis]